MSTIISLLISAIMLSSSAEKACLPVFIIHGLLEPAIRLLPLAETIRKAPDCPNGRNVTIIYLEEVLQSVPPIWEQIRKFKNFLLPHFQSNPNGVHLIGYSQGSLITRTVVESTDNHPVRTLVSLAGVHLGLSGFPVISTKLPGLPVTGTDFFGLENIPIIPGFERDKILWLICYNKLGQSSLSVCNFWRDESHYEEYKNNCVFLPYINNEINHTKSAQYKNNLVTLHNYVLIASSDDGAASPWQTGLFGSLSDRNYVIDMENQEIYKNDSLGLKTLNEAGNLTLIATSGVNHLDLPNDATVINKYIIPYLD